MSNIFKLNKKILPFLKFILPIVALVYIGFQASGTYNDLRQFKFQFEDTASFLYLIPLLLFLLFLNLSLETVKWQYLMLEKRLNFYASYTQILKGATFGFFTPNRSGDFLGRNMHLQHSQIRMATSATITCNLAQLTITVLLGFFSILIYSGLIPSGAHFRVIVIATLIFGVFSFAFLRPNAFYSVFNRITISKRLSGIINTIESYSLKQRSLAVLLSGLRYLVFAIQYILILYHLGYDGELIKLLGAIFLVYFISSMLPSTLLGELGVRESIALIIIGPLMPGPLLAVVASLSLWLVNILLPASAGALLLSKFRYEFKNA